MKKKSSVIHESKNEEPIRHLAAWLKKVSRNVTFTVKKRTRKDGDHYQLIMRYSPTVRALSMFRIGQLFAEFTSVMSNRTFNKLSKEKPEGKTPEEIIDAIKYEGRILVDENDQPVRHDLPF